MSRSPQYSTHREVELLETLRSFGGTARTSNLAAKLNVSEETVRRTIKSLARSGAVRRVHGGVYLSNTETARPISARLSRRAPEKTKIARAAAKLIPNDCCVFMDVGSTTAYTAQFLRNHTGLTVVTNSLHVAQSLAGAAEINIHVAGGEFASRDGGMFGSETAQYLEQFNFDYALLSADAVGERGGFLLNASEEASIARSVANRSEHVMMLVDHSKFGQTAPVVSCNTSLVKTLITDARIPVPYWEALVDWNIDIIVADRDTV